MCLSNGTWKVPLIKTGPIKKARKHTFPRTVNERPLFFDIMGPCRSFNNNKARANYRFETLYYVHVAYVPSMKGWRFGLNLLCNF